MKTKNLAVSAVALAAALALSACGGADGSGAAPSATTAPPGASAESVAGHNEADIAFAQGMIPHHQQAIEMSGLVADRAASDEVRELATDIADAQGPEIEQMQGFLTAWGAPSPTGMSGMDHSAMGHGGMAGMMSPEQMGQLEAAGGPAFDRMWLQMMIAHHEGATQMAQTELRDGTNAEARALAQEIVDTQQAEIDQMRGMLG